MTQREELIERIRDEQRQWRDLIGKDDDVINAWLRERDRARSLDDVLAEYDGSFDRLAAVATILADDALVTPGYFPWMGDAALADAPLFGHLHDEHEPAIRQWLRTRVERPTR